MNEFIELKPVNEIPTVPLSELQTGQMFGYTGTGDLKKVSTNELLGFIKSGIKGIATQANAPTLYDAVTYPNGLFEKWEVVEPITSPNNWGNLTVTQAELDANWVYFNVTNGVVTKALSAKQMPSGSATLNPTDTVEIPSSKATADYLKDNQSLSTVKTSFADLNSDINYNANSIALVINNSNEKESGYYKKIGAIGSGGWMATDSVGFIKKNNLSIYKETLSEIQANIMFENGSLAIVYNEPNPNNNGVYIKSGGVGAGGWVKSKFVSPLFSKPVGENMAIGGGHTSIFQDETGTGVGHTAFGFNAGLNLGNCWATTLIGWNAGKSLSTKSVVNTWTGVIGNTGNTFVGYNIGSVANGALDNTYVGTSAGENLTTGMDNVGVGIWSMRLIEQGSENAGLGHLTLGYLVGKGSNENVDSTNVDPANPLYSWGHRNTAVGDKAGALTGGGNALSFVKKCVYVGCKTSGLGNYSYNENVFGYAATGRGTNTVVIGNSAIKETTIHGSLRMPTLFTVATLPVGLSGERAFVTDATSTNFGASAVGGGSNRMPVYFDGNAWRIG